MLIWKPMCEKPVQWTANSNVFTRVLEVKGWFIFNTCQDWWVFFVCFFLILSFHLRTSLLTEVRCSTWMALGKTKGLDNLVI